MKNSISKMVIAVMVCFVFGVGVAKASTPGPIDADFVLNNSSYHANFGNNSITGAFEDHYTFTAIDPMTGSGGFSAISGFSGFGGFGLGGIGQIGFDVIFSSLGLWDVTDSSNHVLVSDRTVNGFILGFGGFSGLTNGHNYDLVISGELGNGRTSGSYSGNIEIAPVPEPEFYVMLLVGLVLVVFAARSTRRSAYQPTYG
ncbi:MAG: FxDxF family PEP-CTERM protein [Nitrosomonas sp.]|nr:FxDxF family PEP-CTERM protein [Calditrichota bacterium]MDR4517192.1 FxDxF family PEP-CTERM protein [Nitrosomonas sp.]